MAAQALQNPRTRLQEVFAMKKAAIAVFALLLALSLCIGALASTVVVTGDANARSNPSLNGYKLGVVTQGSWLTYRNVYSVDDRGVMWYGITFDGLVLIGNTVSVGKYFNREVPVEPAAVRVNSVPGYARSILYNRYSVTGQDIEQCGLSHIRPPHYGDHRFSVTHANPPFSLPISSSDSGS